MTDAKIGYRSPPVETQYKKGQSGNPGGRPRGSKRVPTPRTSFLDERLPYGKKGETISRREALMRAAAAIAWRKNDLELQRLLISLKEQLDEAQRHIRRDEKFFNIHDLPADRDHISCIEDAADVGGFGKKAYLNRKTGRVLLETWVVQEALDRLGERRLSRVEQELVLAATRFPKRILWPAWWDNDLRGRGAGWRAKQNPDPHPSPKHEDQSMGLKEYLAFKERLQPRLETYLDENNELQERWTYRNLLPPE